VGQDFRLGLPIDFAGRRYNSAAATADTSSVSTSSNSLSA